MGARGQAVDNVVRAAHRVRVNRGRRRDPMRVALSRRFTSYLMADLLLKRHKAVFTGGSGATCRLPDSLMLYLVVMNPAATSPQVRRLRRIALRLFTLAIVLAVEQVVRADGHLLVVLLLVLLAG